MERDKEKLANLEIAVVSIGEEYRRQMKILAKELEAISSSVQSGLKIDWPQFRIQLEKSCERIANLDWAIPMSFAPGQLIDLAEHTNTDQEIEQYMLDYFTFENGRFFLDLRRHVLGSENLVGWRALLEQCFDAYDRGHYLVLIPALLSVIEGAVAQHAGKFSSAQVNPQKLAADLEKAAPPGSIQFAVWHSSRVVLDRLFASCDFGGSQPERLNRHWALHGRDQTQWTQTDALRLFDLLFTIS